MSIKKLPFYEVRNYIGFGFMRIAFINYDIRIEGFIAYQTDRISVLILRSNLYNLRLG